MARLLTAAILLGLAPACVQQVAQIRTVAAERMDCPRADVQLGRWSSEWIAIGCGKAYGCESFRAAYECTPALGALAQQLQTELGCDTSDFQVVGPPLFREVLRVRVRACGTIHLCTLSSRHALAECRPAPVAETRAGPADDAPLLTERGTPTPAVPFGDGITRPVPDPGNRPPQYSREALEAHLEGLMLVRCTITTDGRVSHCRVIKPLLPSLPGVEQDVLDALLRWKFQPATKDGRAIAVDYVLPVRFSIPGP